MSWRVRWVSPMNDHDFQVVWSFLRKNTNLPMGWLAGHHDPDFIGLLRQSAVLTPRDWGTINWAWYWYVERNGGVTIGIVRPLHRFWTILVALRTLRDT
jgi:hypothetical protein